MHIPKWMLLLEVAFTSMGRNRKTAWFMEKTGLPRGYCSKYLTTWGKIGIFSRTREGWLLVDDAAATGLISRSQNATQISHVCTPPPNAVAEAHHYMIGKTVYFGHPDTQALIQAHKERHQASLEGPFIRYTAAGDRARRLIIRGESFTASISQVTWNGTITGIKRWMAWQDELGRVLGGSVLEQVKTEELMAHVETKANELMAGVMKTFGIGVDFEPNLSQMGGEGYELHGMSEEKARLSISLATKRRLEDTATFVKIADTFTQLKGDIAGLEAAIKMDIMRGSKVVELLTGLSERVEKQGEAMLRLAERLAPETGQVKPEPQNGANPAVIEPYKGRDPGVG